MVNKKRDAPVKDHPLDARQAKMLKKWRPGPQGSSLEVAAPEIYEKYSDQALKDDPWRFPRWKTPEKRLEKPSRALKDDP